MNLIHLPMDVSAVVRKMKSVASAPTSKPGKAADVTLTMKKELSEVSSLNISLKPAEVKKIAASSGSGSATDTQAC